jgi:hypothetical protein
MAKTWLLDTETKGTGAHLVPLEEALRKPGREPELATVRLERPPRLPDPPEPPGPLRFKVLDIRSARVLAEGIDTRATIDLLATVDSVVDVRVYVWRQSAGRWRLLSLDEQRKLWRFRAHAPAS